MFLNHYHEIIEPFVLFYQSVFFIFFLFWVLPQIEKKKKKKCGKSQLCECVFTSYELQTPKLKDGKLAKRTHEIDLCKRSFNDTFVFYFALFFVL